LSDLSRGSGARAAADEAKFSWFIPFLGALSALGPLSNDLYVPSLPLVASGLGVGGGAVQLTLSTLLLGLSLGALIYGPLSDQYGRRPVLAVGLALYVVAGVMAALAHSLGALVFWRFLQGLGASSGNVLARAIVLDRWRGEQASRALSWMAIVTFLSPVLAPVIGGQIASFGRWPTIFWVHAAAGAVCLLVALASVPRSQRDASRLLASIAAYGVILRDRQAVGHIACMASGFVGVVPLIANSSWVFQDYFGLTPFRYGLCFSLMMLGGSLGAYFNSRIVARAGIAKLLGIGTASMAAGGALALALTLLGAGIPGILIPGVLYMFGVGFTFANALARTMSRFPHAMGAASAVFGFNQFLIGGLVAAALSSLSEPSPLPLAATMTLAGATCAALWWGWLRRLPA
jgi:DHA1 family bicyclomycin/chloramphenicol resistance-like MFS transporter